MLISAIAGLLNLTTALILLQAGRKHGSITLEADARHLLSDVWTTVAILLALGGIHWTGWLLLDPLIAGMAALQILWSGIHLIRRSISGLLDAAIPMEEVRQIKDILDDYRGGGVDFHDLRTRQSGGHRLLTLHVLVPGQTTVQQGHDLLERIEAEIRLRLQNITIVTHLEPIEDHSSFTHEQVIQHPPAKTHGPNKPKPPPRAIRRTNYRRRRIGGGILFLGSSAASMVLQGLYADLAMGISILGLLLALSGSRGRSGD
jgi:divalent metal cation (Fe/Co/Zn/Cd) transporter